MPLSVGTRLGPYEIVAPIGSGGMGDVYRARDTKLDRAVAIKTLPELFSTNPDRVARFTREAKTLAALNHPNIAQIHGLEESHGVSALVMELVDGPTLAERIARGAIPIEDALRIARQIAEALEAAHEHGIVHRDLKPGNVKVRDDGTVKVLDFGLAKALGSADAGDDGANAGPTTNSPTLTSPAVMTGAGVILGTAAYMAPEQAKGRAVDKRADIWAFGCVLYEMLAGRRAFTSDNMAELVLKILDRDPDWAALPASTPAAVIHLLHGCLQKDPRRRLHDIADVRITIDDALEPGEGTRPTSEAPRKKGATRSAAITLVGMLLTGAAAVVATVAAMWNRSTAEPAPILRVSLVLPADAPVGFNELPLLAIAPDGRRVAYVAEFEGVERLHIRELDRTEVLPVAGTDRAAGPFFSPDGQQLAFFADHKLKRIAIAGGAPVTLADAMAPRGGTWGRDGTIVYTPAPGAGLWRVAAQGGTPRPITRPDLQKDERTHRWPDILPDGRHLLFTIRSGSQASFDDAQIAVGSIETGTWRVVFEGAADARYAPPGYVVFARAASLFALPFDMARLEVTGPPAPLGVRAAMEDSTGAAHFAVSASGSLVYVEGPVRSARRSLRWIDRTGTSQQVTDLLRAFATPRLSPDGRRALVSTQEASDNVWIYDTGDGSLTRRTFAAGSNIAPIWTRDGKSITFSSNRAGVYHLFSAPADGSGTARQLLAATHAQFPGSWAPDGRTLAFVESHPTNGADIWLLSSDEDKAQPFLVTRADERDPEFSPDGRWLAYTSNESGRDEVYVRPYGERSEGIQVSVDGGTCPAWNADGRDLFYQQGNRIVSVALEAGRLFRAGRPRILFEGVSQGDTMTGERNWDVAPDGQRVMTVKSEEPPPPGQLHVLFNWMEELKRGALRK